MPRWAEEDEVSKWRVKYRLNNEKAAEDPDSEWIELELRHFTRELPLSNLPPGVHHFRVAIETPDGWSDWSPPVECEPPPPQVPSKLASLLCEVLGVDAVKVRWSPPLDTATARAIVARDRRVRRGSESVQRTSAFLQQAVCERAPHQWTQMNDPVMGGQSSCNFTVADGVGVLLGQVADVPYLKAPGFIQAYVTDVSPFEIFPDITGCKSLSLEVKSMVDYKGYRFSFGSAHAPGGKFHAYGYKSNFDAGKVAEWNTVTLPIEGFTDFWDDATGEAIKTCQENKIYCPDATTLKDMRTMAFWAEGLKGQVHLQIKSVKATDCTNLTKLSGEPKSEILVEEATDFYVVTGLVSLTDAWADRCWSEWSEPSTKQTEPPVPKTLNQPTLRRSTHHSAAPRSADWSGEVVEITDVSPSLSQYVITGLRPGQVYIFQVRAVNRYGKGIWSEGSIPIRTTDGSIPAKIETLKASDIYQSFIRLKWAPVDENGYPITGYLLRYAHEEDMAEATEAGRPELRPLGGTIDFGTGESTTESTVSSEEVKGEAISSDHGSCHTASDTSGSVSVAPTSTMPTGKGKMERARAKLARRKKKDKKKSCKGQCVDTTTQCWLCQKKINEELIAGSQQSRAALEGVIERQLPRMNGVNLATAFHRFVRSGDRSHGHGDSGIFTTMLQHVQEQAEMEFQLGDGRMPSNCCTLIAWSCACYGQFDRESFVLLSRLAARDLSACQDYEVTNLLWAWSQLYKSQSPIISSLEGDLELFLDTLAAHVAVRGPLKPQLLISALTSLANLPGKSPSEGWLFSTVGKEVIKSWEQLTVQGRQQAAAAFKFTRLRDRQFFADLAVPLIRKCPGLAQMLGTKDPLQGEKWVKTTEVNLNQQPEVTT
ncbi:Chaperone protein DnaJ [Durusdinium trenchii]|uniref:Chaperone protein DnaJ n=1 Tax=Durusdinium trenchii TaxID=1381693 RepID=A0ABP0PR85_9DINO